MAALHLPLGKLLGSMVAIAGWRPLGVTVAVPEPLRLLFVPVIGVSIGGAFPGALLCDALGWWPRLLARMIYLPLALGSG